MKYILIALLLIAIVVLLFYLFFFMMLWKQSKKTPQPTNLAYRNHSDAVCLWDADDLPYKEKGLMPYMVPYLLDYEAPAVVIVPGGGYMRVAMEWEGESTAKKLNEMGYHAFVLDYRIYPAVYPAAHLDLIRAIQMVRNGSEQWNIKANQIFALGFSAGGHLVASLPGICKELIEESGDLSHVDAMPNGLILGYPVTNFTRNIYGFIPFHDFLLGPGHKRGLPKQLSPERQVTPDYPPTYLWALEKDQLVNAKKNSIKMKKALEQSKVPHQLHIFPGKQHGSSLSVGMEAEIWLEEAVAFIESYVIQKDKTETA